MRQFAWVGALSWWSCQSPLAHRCGLLNHPNSFSEGMFKLNTRFDADSLLYFFSHFECISHIVHMPTQQRLLPPLTSTVKLSLFTHVQSSPLAVAARFHRCGANSSCCINNGWTVFRQTSVYQLIMSIWCVVMSDRYVTWLDALNSYNVTWQLHLSKTGKNFTDRVSLSS